MVNYNSILYYYWEDSKVNSKTFPFLDGISSLSTGFDWKSSKAFLSSLTNDTSSKSSQLVSYITCLVTPEQAGAGLDSATSSFPDALLEA